MFDAIVIILSEYLLLPYTECPYEEALNFFLYVERCFILGVARSIFMILKNFSDVERFKLSMKKETRCWLLMISPP